MYRISLIVFTLLFYFCLVLTAFATNNIFDELDPYITSSMNVNQIPGLAIAIVQDDKIVFIKGYGVRELGKPQPVDENTVFAIGSTTKAFTTCAIGMLVQQGKIEWDKPVIDYMPDFRMYDPWVTREITVRDLLSNRNGLGSKSEYLWFDGGLSREETIRHLRYIKPESSFRSQYAYRNAMFITGGQIIPAVTGISWDDFIKKNILTPLNMKRSNTSTHDLLGMDNVASPHTIYDDTLIAIPYRNIDNAGPAGSINSSVRDMAQWVRLQLGNGTYEGKKIIGAEQIEETHKPEIMMPIIDDLKKLYPSMHFLSYCMGWVAQDYQGYQMIWHTGGIDGMLSIVGLIPEKNLGLVILTNYDQHSFNNALLYYAIDMCLGLPKTDYDEFYREALKKRENKIQEKIKKVEESRIPNTNPSLPLSAFTGDYHTDYLDLKVTLEDDQLVLHFGSFLSGTLKHWHYDTFQVTWNGIIAFGGREPDSLSGAGFVTFNLDEQGKVVSLQKDELGPFLRVEEKK